MTAMVRQIGARDSFRRRMFVPGVVALGLLGIAVLPLAIIEYLSGATIGAAILVVTTIGGACAVLALVIVAIANVRLTRTADIDGARMQAMMAAMKDGVCCLDESGGLTYMNRAAERMLGRTFEDHAGQPLAAVFPAQRRDGRPSQEDSPIFSGVLKDDAYQGRDAVVCASGTVLCVYICMEPIVLEGERAGAVLVFSDDTDRTREEEAKDDFVGFASHELRSPLTVLHGFSSWLANKLESEPWRFDADTAEAIAALAAETGRMESIIELFLDLTQIRMDKLNLEPDLVDLKKLLREEGAAVRSRYPAADVVESVPQERVLAIMDEQRLRQIVLNLLDNAAKYGGARPRIVVSLNVSGEVAELRVRDSGSGIPSADKRHIFERFFRSTAAATEQKKGLGIGLYVTKQIVDRMGGEISFISEEGNGTEFAVRLPLGRDEVPTVEAAPDQEPALALR